jgi:ATP-dependent RNA helicase DeaD
MLKPAFDTLDLSPEILSAIRDMGFEEASPIQAQTIPVILSGKDVIGQSQTGTGKTAAFAIPVIEQIDPNSRKLQAVILCPTRELVVQVTQEFHKLIKYKHSISVVPIYGGQPIERQLMAMRKNPQIVVATPGRMMDHMRRGSVQLDQVDMVVLDEADEMLDMGFRDDIETMLSSCKEDRQTILFSATMAKEIIALTKRYQQDPAIINVMREKMNAPNIKQVYFEVVERNKPELLTRLIDAHSIKLAVVFCNTKTQVDQLVEVLKTRGYFADALHGDMSQTHRDKVMNGFRQGTVEILVATDVAGRGIDVNNVEAVFNYDLPRDDEDYVHRIGRTARAGRSGTAFSFIHGKQVYAIKRLERMNGSQITRGTIPTVDELENLKVTHFGKQATDLIQEKDIQKYVQYIEQFMGDEYTSLDIAAALLKLLMDKETKGFDASIDLEAPVPFHEERRPGGGQRRGGYYGGGGSGNRFGGGGQRQRQGDGRSDAGRNWGQKERGDRHWYPSGRSNQGGKAKHGQFSDGRFSSEDRTR